MQPHTNLLLAKILVVIAAVLVVMNLRSPSSASEAPDRTRTTEVSPKSGRLRPRTPPIRPEASTVRHWKLQLAENRVEMNAERRLIILELADELDRAIANGLDPDGEDARTYQEAMHVLLADSRNRPE